MALTEAQRDLVYQSLLKDQAGKSAEQILRRLVNFILTHTPAEVNTELRRVVQENRDEIQGRYDGADAAIATHKNELLAAVSDLEDTDAELAS